MKDKKQTILNFLKKGRNSTTKIASVIKSNIWMTYEYLEQLEQEGKITKEQETNSCYWELKE